MSNYKPYSSREAAITDIPAKSKPKAAKKPKAPKPIYRHPAYYARQRVSVEDTLPGHIDGGLSYATSRAGEQMALMGSPLVQLGEQFAACHAPMKVQEDQDGNTD